MTVRAGDNQLGKDIGCAERNLLRTRGDGADRNMIRGGCADYNLLSLTSGSADRNLVSKT